jgi:cyclopropane-fatty-acyl-phospholipid synthase
MQIDNTVVSKDLVSNESSKTSLIIELLRNSLFKKIDQLEETNLLIQDQDGTYHFGKNFAVVVKIHKMSFYKRLAFAGTMGLAESYLDGEWSCNNLYGLFSIFAKNRKVIEKIDSSNTYINRLFNLFREKSSKNTLTKSKSNIHAHYDMGNELFENFLDPTMTYSSGYFRFKNMNLEQASLAKIDRLCNQLNLSENDHLLEIGTGWGSTAIRVAEKYGCKVTTTTLSLEQKSYAEHKIKSKGLENKITVLLQDYRNLDGQFDKIISIEMIEAIGPQYYGVYFKKCSSLLKENGLLAIQSITIPDNVYTEHLKNVDFIQKYIFPGSKIPCTAILNKYASEDGQFVMDDLFDLSQDYAKTMLQWYDNFMTNIVKVKGLGYDERFVRMWSYYLHYCAAGFKERYLGTVQLLFRKNG